MKNKHTKSILRFCSGFFGACAFLIIFQGCTGMSPYYYDPYYTRGYVNYPYPVPQHHTESDGEYVGSPEYGQAAETKIEPGDAPQDTVHHNPNVHPQHMHAPRGYPHPYSHDGTARKVKSSNSCCNKEGKPYRFLDERLGDY